MRKSNPMIKSIYRRRFYHRVKAHDYGVLFLWVPTVHPGLMIPKFYPFVRIIEL